MTEEDAKSFFALAGFKVLRIWELKNLYWPPAYQPPPTGSWWLMQTDKGLIRIGERKRVVDIDWSATEQPRVITKDDVTQAEYHVHAWTNAKVIEYLTELHRQLA